MWMKRSSVKLSFDFVLVSLQEEMFLLSKGPDEMVLISLLKRLNWDDGFICVEDGRWVIDKKVVNLIVDN